LAFAAAAFAGAAFPGDKVSRMDAAELVPQLESSDIVIIDVRRDSDWEGSERVIKSAVRKPYNDVDGWADEISMDKTVVLYCA